jgi:hypothetical protein
VKSCEYENIRSGYKIKWRISGISKRILGSSKEVS